MNTSTETLNFSKICRVCCFEGSMMSVFKVNIHKKIMACASIQVWQNDGLPGQICNKCVSKLHISYQFKKLCERSDIRLRNCKESGKFLENKLDSEVNSERLAQREMEQHREDEELSSMAPTMNESQNYTYTDCTSGAQHSYEHLQGLGGEVQLEQQLVYGGVMGGGAGGQLHLSASPSPYSLQTLTTTSPAYSFNVPPTMQPHPTHIQAHTLTHTGGPQMITLETLNVSGQNQHPVRNHLQTFNLPQMSSSAPPDHNKKVMKPLPPPAAKKKVSKLIKKEKPMVERDAFKCPVCNKTFASNGKLTRHMKTHSGEQPFKCKICQKGFSHGGNYKVHMRMHNDERPFACRICHKACRQQQDLDKHMRTHTGERPHTCDTCHRAFTTSSNLIAHERIHSGEKPYVCCVCQKAFCQSNELTKHMRTHTGEKSHVCPVCDKGFNGSSTLNVHMRIHTGERPYVCNVCSKGFTQSSCLAVHARRHLSQAFLCARCPRSFPSALELRMHTRAHAQAATSLLCPKPGCSHRFTQHAELMRHTKTH